MIISALDHVVHLVHAVVGNSDMLSVQVTISIWLFRNGIIIEIIIAECLGEMFKSSHFTC